MTAKQTIHTGLGRLRRGLRQVRNRFVTGGVILLYHRVTDRERDPQLLSVSPVHFAEHLALLRRDYHPLSLAEMAAHLDAGTLPPRSVAITFDDGYADNLQQAAPLLASYDTPATVFVATGYTGSERLFWWDSLERLLLMPGQLPSVLSISISGTEQTWTLGASANYTDAEAARYADWHVLNPTDPGPRQHIYRALCGLLRPLPSVEREVTIAHLWKWAGRSPGAAAADRAMDSRELSSLAATGLVKLGAHTVNHPQLSALTFAEQQQEITQSKAALEAFIERPVTIFSYPYGGRGDFNRASSQIARETGFAVACANWPDLTWRGSDRFRLPRHLVRDWSGLEFVRHLHDFFRG